MNLQVPWKLVFYDSQRSLNNENQTELSFLLKDPLIDLSMDNEESKEPKFKVAEKAEPHYNIYHTLQTAASLPETRRLMTQSNSCLIKNLQQLLLDLRLLSFSS